MDPFIEESIVRTNQGSWLLGSTMICEIASEVPNDALKSWKDEDDGKVYCLRTLSEDGDTFTKSRKCGDSKTDLIHQAGTSAAVWKIGGMFIKVKGWRHGMQLETDTIRFVNKVSSLPTPTVVHSWVDSKWNRSFLILESVKGRTLAQAWTSLPSPCLPRLADTVAQFCKALASSTSERLETADGKGIVEPFLTAQPPASEPSWKPQFLGPYTVRELQNYLSSSSAADDIMHFVFGHADLGPTNIIIDDNGDLVAIIDWESAAFYPLFWLGTKPLVSAGFYLPEGVEDRKAWANILAKALEREGFAPNIEKYKEWENVTGR